MLTRYQRITSRLLELELLVTSSIVLVLSLSMFLVVSAHTLNWKEVGVAAALPGLFLCVSLVLAWRGWGEDQVLLPLVLLLSGLGILIARRLEPDLTLRYAGIYGSIAARQSIWVLAGIGVLVALNFVPWRMRWLKHYRYSWLLLGLLLIVITLFFGKEHNGTRLWLDVGSFQIQPVELLKILLVVYLATYLDDHRDMIGATYYLGGVRLPPLPYLLPLLLMWGLTIGLIIFQRDLGAALLFFTIFLCMLYLLTGRVAYVAAGIIAFTLGAATLYPFFSHVRVRLDAWYDPWSDPLNTGYQTIQALYALASGGYVGRGFGLGDPTMIPESHTDFIFVAIGEELGMIGALGVLLCYLLLALRGYQIALRVRDGFQQLLAAGLTTAVAAQALIITAGTTNLIPLTGITLPFISYGGSSTLVNFAIIGLLMRISATRTSPRVW